MSMISAGGLPEFEGDIFKIRVRVQETLHRSGCLLQYLPLSSVRSLTDSWVARQVQFSRRDFLHKGSGIS